MTSIPAPLPVDLPDPAALSERALTRVRECGGSTVDLGRFLDTIPEAYVEESGAAEAARWEITDEGAADWALRMYGRAQARAQEIGDQVARWHAQIDQWAADVVRSEGVSADLEFFGDHLTLWAQARRKANPDVATLRLPSGEIATAKHQARPVVTDPHALVAWARESAPAAVETTYKVPAAAVKALGRIADDGLGDEGSRMLVTAAGEQVPGVTIEPERIGVTIRPHAPAEPEPEHETFTVRNHQGEIVETR